MSQTQETLRAIQNFDQLIRYLEDELGWPLQEYGFDELTFEYSPQELGIKEQDAAKITKIHQLRPLYTGQPWGIFFVEFETKKLPVVVLRRILSHLVVKKRASDNSATAAAWNTEDLLFISAFGESSTNSREIAFAHFHQEYNSSEQPVLRVLGWDGGDTPLKLDYIADVLKKSLCWPDKHETTTKWQRQWRKAFKTPNHIIKTTKELAAALAALAGRIRSNALVILARESELGSLRRELTSFKNSLLSSHTKEIWYLEPKPPKISKTAFLRLA